VKTVYLSLGSNLGHREAHLRAAIERLPAAGIHVLRTSPVYETEPVDYTEQRCFLNLVLEAGTGLYPMQLLSRIGRIERALGRVRTLPKGPRTIDIDILLYGQAVVRSSTLEIPHPRMAERRFVLAPLADLAPGLRHPVSHKTVREMLEAAPAQTVRLIHSGLRCPTSTQP
jgi:2-amino-4-hydroxy-6-hydroxymethyldihydropteridine diphosphokinase